MNNGYNVHAVYTDFSKAFDRVNHDILLQKLSAIDVRVNALKWISSYLVDIRLQVKIDGHLSSHPV